MDGSSSSTSRRARRRTTSSPRVRRALGDAAGRATPARWTRSRPGCCSSSSAARTRIQRFLMALPKAYEAIARFGAVSTTGDPEGEITETGRMPPTRCALPTGESASARRPTARSRSTGERAYELARARRGRRAARARGHGPRASSSSGATATAPGFAIECSSGTYVRIARRRPRRRLLRGAAAHGDRPVRRRATPIPAASSPLADALALHAGGAPGRRRRARRASTAARSRIRATAPRAPSCSSTPAGPIAVAEPRDGALKPIVGFRA